MSVVVCVCVCMCVCVSVCSHVKNVINPSFFYVYLCFVCALLMLTFVVGTRAVAVWDI